MKRLSLILLATVLGAASLMARPALKGTVRMQQPDGTYLTARLVGDEYCHFSTTEDGYSVVRNADGFYVYATKDSNGQLAPTDLVAHDAGERTAADMAYLERVGRMLTPETAAPMAEMRQKNQAARAKAQSAMKAASYDYSNFRGLVILVEYNDCPFRYDDYHDIMERMINEDNYVGEARTNIYRNENGNSNFTNKDIVCTGSMRDYYRDNSAGMFVPTFDVVGPVKIDYSQYDAGRGGNAAMMVAACTAADDQVNFKDYDVNSDGVVDMIFFVFSGLPSYIQGNDERLLWPHQSDISYSMNVRKDGVRLGRYACSTELYGYEKYNWSVLEGIGTMCHEFSHILGLPDFYDADHEGSGGQSDDPGTWSVMAAGADFNFGRCPCGYSLFERYFLGFATPQLIKEPGRCSMDYLGTSNTGYRLNSSVNKEFFIIENRQRTGWDAQLPGHGMLIFRVDSTNRYVWSYNAVNNNPSHNYYEVIRAGGVKRRDGVAYGAASDPFPGSAKVTTIDNKTTPANLLSWSKKSTPFGLRNISEQNGVVTFDVFDVSVLTSVTLVESVTIGVGASMQLVPEREPDYVPYKFTWTSNNEAVATVDQEGVVIGVSAGVAHVTVMSDSGLSATCEVTVDEMMIASDIAAFRALEEGSAAFLMLHNAKVLYVDNSNNIYLRDASGSIVLSDVGLNVTRNQVLNGGLYGTLAISNRMPQLQAVEGKTDLGSVNATDGNAAQPVALHISQLTADRYADMVTVECAQLVSDGGVYAVFGDRKVRLWNTFKITSPKIVVPKDYTLRYDITAIYGTNTVNGEVIDEFYLLQSPEAASYTTPDSLGLPASLRLTLGRSYQFTPVMEPAGARAWLSWTSSDEQVVTVNGNGLLTTVAEGSAVVTVTDLETGLEAQCSVMVGERQEASSIAEFKALPEGCDATLNLENAEVLFVKGDDVYLRDATGAIILRGFDDMPLEANMRVSGTLSGELAFEDRMPLILPVDGGSISLTAVTGEAVQPREVTLPTLTDSDLADMVVLRAATLLKDGGVYAYSDDIRVRLWNTFLLSGIKVPTVITGKYFDVTAILTTVTLNGELTYQLSLLQSPVEVDEPKIKGDTNGDGEVNSSDVVFIYEFLVGEQPDADPKTVDVNGDGEINSSDVVRVYEIMSGGKK